MMGKRLVLSAVCLWGSLMSVFSQDAKVFDADSFNVAVTYMMPVSYPAHARQRKKACSSEGPPCRTGCGLPPPYFPPGRLPAAARDLQTPFP